MLGIFDSGIGGLTVVKSILRLLPQYQLMYLGDTARLPYGNRSPNLIYEFTQEGVQYLFSHGCELVIIACNTSSAQALRRIQGEYLFHHYPERRVLGVIRPFAEEAARVTKNKRVGVIGTRGTVSSGAYIREIKAQNAEIEVFQSACPLLVSLIEEGWLEKMETKKILRSYARPLKDKKIDTLILGCTHYQILFSQIVKAMGKRVFVINPADTVAHSLQNYFDRHPEIEKRIAKGNKHEFYVTDITETFSKTAWKWLGQKIHLKKANIENV